ncbi:histidine--tRNA ligase [Candidatus Woesearchaeota archaeon]|nr:histidine--tRNA ligase [Candidatus Woesearchaeota archaeon]
MYQKVKGTRDFYPEEFGSRWQVFSSIRNTVKKFGFSEIESPAFESFDLLSAKQGEEIRSQIFTLEKQGKEDLGLRFDLTVPFARMFTSVQMSSKKPVKWYGLSRMWRYEQPQKGRLREFYQLSVEMYGTNSIDSDFETVALAISVLKDLGLTSDDFVIRINNRKLLQGFIESLKIGSKYVDSVFRVVDSYTKSSSEDFRKELSEIGLDSKQVDYIVEFMTVKLEDLNELEMDSVMREGYTELKGLFSMLECLGMKDFVEFNPFIARGLSYYTGLVFECFDRQGKFRAILGGGRYDNLVSLFGGQSTPAIGFAIGDVTLELLLRDREKWPKPSIGPEYFVACVSDSVRMKAYEIAMKLRNKFSVDVDLSSRKLAKQLFYANSIGAKWTVIVGEDELKENKVVLRDMVLGTEHQKDLDELLD